MVVIKLQLSSGSAYFNKSVIRYLIDVDIKEAVCLILFISQLREKVLVITQVGQDWKLCQNINNKFGIIPSAHLFPPAKVVEVIHYGDSTTTGG